MPGLDRDRFDSAWQGDPPRWVRILAAAVERSSQNEAGRRLGISAGYVNRAVYNNYGASLAEIERKVLATFADDRIICPVWNDEIGLRACMRNRRRKTAPRNSFHHAYDRACPSCPHNTDRPATEEGEL
ncbi:hypothetical protein B5C34_05295 [Pacificimonas flava]|uniref:Transcriptional regulator n=2 Tax=Pacificimonas TaxID=1960290 RepID=A0A219B3L1_9SPHN|nr:MULTISPECIES: hypothetical protein [Pacificimonas]MBZ6377365.1 hypothetical protein [Pacificimonas aurantium]OWV32927.1 hypothetical protein B5C34_05295 [Pacificimonas flava]